jgi:hypothetical protein
VSGDSERVVVLDTNFVGRGRLQVDAVRQLAGRLSERGHSVVIPEVVVWEWAQHAFDALQEARVALDKASRDVDGRLCLTLPELQVPDVLQLVDTISSVLLEMPGVTILASDDASPSDAVQQQVLQIGLGIRKAGVKTGAADALVLSSVEVLVESCIEVVLCSGDKLLAETTEKLDLADDQKVSVARTTRARRRRSYETYD